MLFYPPLRHGSLIRGDNERVIGPGIPLNFEFVCYIIMWSVHAPACTDYNPQNKGSDKVSCDCGGTSRMLCLLLHMGSCCHQDPVVSVTGLGVSPPCDK